MEFKINKIQISSNLKHKSAFVNCYTSNSYDNIKISELINDFIVDFKANFCLLLNDKPNFDLINKLIFSPYYLKLNNNVILFIDEALKSKYSEAIINHVNDLGFSNFLLYPINPKETYLIDGKKIKKFSKNETELLLDLARNNFTIIGDIENLIKAEIIINQAIHQNNKIIPFIENIISLNEKNFKLKNELFYTTTDLKNSKINLEIQTKNLQKEIEWCKEEIKKITNWGHTEIQKTKDYYENKYINLPLWFIKIGNIFFNRKNKL